MRVVLCILFVMIASGRIEAAELVEPTAPPAISYTKFEIGWGVKEEIEWQPFVPVSVDLVDVAQVTLEGQHVYWASPGLLMFAIEAIESSQQYPKELRVSLNVSLPESKPFLSFWFFRVRFAAEVGSVEEYCLPSFWVGIFELSWDRYAFHIAGQGN